MRGSLASMDKEGKLPRILRDAMVCAMVCVSGRQYQDYTNKQEDMEGNQIDDPPFYISC